MHDRSLGEALLALARGAIAAQFGRPETAADHAALERAPWEDPARPCD